MDKVADSNRERKIEILRECVKAFRKPPDRNLYNDFGLCNFLRSKYNKDINWMYDNITQKKLYDKNEKGKILYERANYCQNILRKLETE